MCRRWGECVGWHDWWIATVILPLLSSLLVIPWLRLGASSGDHAADPWWLDRVHCARAHYELFIRALDAPNVRDSGVCLVHPTCGPTQVRARPRAQGPAAHGPTCAQPAARQGSE
jgi:hypothetical protein